jgi:hypothetical protein
MPSNKPANPKKSAYCPLVSSGAQASRDEQHHLVVARKNSLSPSDLKITIADELEEGSDSPVRLVNELPKQIE